MKHLYYIRHGESEANVADIWSGGDQNAVLTEKGLQQAIAAGKKAEDEGIKFDVILSSPQIRAHTTALKIAESVGYPGDSIQLTNELKERHFGVLEGAPHDKDLYDSYWNDETAIDDIEGVEKLSELSERAKNMLAYLKSRPEDTILIVSHGAFGRMLRRELEGLAMTAHIEAYPNAQLVKLL